VKRAAPLFAALAALLPTAAWAQDAKCGQLEIVNRIQMIPVGNRDLVPVTIDGAKRNLLFDTGGYFTQVSPALVQELDLSHDQGSAVQDITGRRSTSVATVKEFIAGQMRGTYLNFQVATINAFDGLFALDRWQGVDLDVDFGTDTLNMFSQKHCPGAVQYWTAPAIAVIPVTMDGNHVTVPVTLDGHQETALIDTGSVFSTLDEPEEENLFHLILGGSDTPESNNLNGDASLKTYNHVFTNLSFGDVAVNNPKITIIPPPPTKILGRAAAPEPYKMLIGMDVLRKLHIYFAFGEKKMYVSQASVPTPEHMAQQVPLALAAIRLTQKTNALAAVTVLDNRLYSDPKNVTNLNLRCYWKATVKSDLDAALADCDQGLALKPGDSNLLNNRALVLYQQGKYQEALDAYNAALAVQPKNGASLFVRGIIKGKLGDQPGKDADIAAAKAIQSDIEVVFQSYDIDF
jgi:hypothetical protein